MMKHPLMRVFLAVAATAAFVAPALASATTTASAAYPLNASWSRDRATGIQWLTWTDGNLSNLSSDGTLGYHVDAQDSNGLKTIQVWVNGTVKQTCSPTGSVNHEICSYVLNGADYPTGSEIFVNAKIVSTLGSRTAWTIGSRIRNTKPVTAAVSTPAVTATASSPVFQTTATLVPDVTQISAGSALTLHAVSQNNTVGLERVEISSNGTLVGACTFGAAVSPMTCDAAINTQNLPAGTVLNLASRAVDNDGHDAWSATKTVVLTGAVSASNLPTLPDMSVWSWLSPNVSQLTDGQTATYSVNGSSKNGIARIDLTVDGSIVRTCVESATSAQPCSYDLTTDGFSHGHRAVINARVTDTAGRVLWSDPRTVTMVRTWLPFVDPGALISIATDHANGYQANDKVTFQVNGWSSNGVGHIDLFANGTKVYSCPSDVCTWTSPALTSDRIEYQARVVDTVNQSTWTPLTGLLRQ